MFSGGPAAGDGPDFHRAGAASPVEGVDYGLGELPPELMARLEATKAELLDHARSAAARTPSRRVRRRTASLAMASLLAFGVVGAGASALVTGSTGVPSVDRLLGLYEEGLSKPDSPDVGRALAPRADTTSVSVEAPLGQSGHRVVNTVYVGRDGKVCLAAARTDDARSEGLGSVRCLDSSSLGTQLVQNGGTWAVTTDERVVLHGVARGDVTSLSGRGPNGALKTYLGDVWVSGLPGVGAMRPFLAIGDADIGNAPQAEAFDRLTDPTKYVLEGRSADGGSTLVAP